MSFPQDNNSFPQLNKSFPQDFMLFPQLNKSFPQDIMLFPRLNKLFPRLNKSFLDILCPSLNLITHSLDLKLFPQDIMSFN